MTAIPGSLGIGTTSAQSALDVAGALTQRGSAAPSLAPMGEGRIYYDSSSNQFMVSQNGAAYAPLGTVTGGTITQISPGPGLAGGGTSGNVTVGLAGVGTAGTYTKVQTDAYGRVTAGGTLTAADLPGIPGLSHQRLAADRPALGHFGGGPSGAYPGHSDQRGTWRRRRSPRFRRTDTGTLAASQIAAIPATQLTGTLTATQIPGRPRARSAR